MSGVLRRARHASASAVTVSNRYLFLELFSYPTYFSSIVVIVVVSGDHVLFRSCDGCIALDLSYGPTQVKFTMSHGHVALPTVDLYSSLHVRRFL